MGPLPRGFTLGLCREAHSTASILAMSGFITAWMAAVRASMFKLGRREGGLSPLYGSGKGLGAAAVVVSVVHRRDFGTRSYPSPSTMVWSFAVGLTGLLWEVGQHEVGQVAYL